MVQFVIIFFLFSFLGYIAGRWGDNYLNIWLKDPAWAPHHWIYGIILMASPLLFPGIPGLLIFSFGTGLFISDLKDFLDFKIIGKDNKLKDQIKFWHID